MIFGNSPQAADLEKADLVFFGSDLSVIVKAQLIRRYVYTKCSGSSYNYGN